MALDLLEYEARPTGAGNTNRPLTHSSDSSREGLAVNATQPCPVAGCDRHVLARGLCNLHYKRAKRDGTLPPKKSRQGWSQERFWQRVEKTSECWIWRGSLTRQGYGQFGYAPGKTGRAHKLAWEWQNGSVPEGLVLDHLCRNRACVRPEHLEPVTPRTNALRGIGPTAINSRKRFCNQGHEFTAENTMRGSKGERICRVCSYRKASEWGRSNRNAKPCGAPNLAGRPCAHRISEGKVCRYHATYRPDTTNPEEGTR